MVPVPGFARTPLGQVSQSNRNLFFKAPQKLSAVFCDLLQFPSAHISL